MSDNEPPLDPEAWAWYGITMTVVFGRFLGRYLQLRGIKKMTWEDLAMVFVAILYTIEIVLLTKIRYTPTNLIIPGTFDPNDKDLIAQEIYGSKLIVALEMVYCATIWGCKGALLLLYANLTFALPVNYTWTKLVACYVVMGYLVMVILYFGVWCQPFSNYWSVPAANAQCSTAENHLILNCVLNISSDLMIMMIPIPLLVRTRLPLRKKLMLWAIFSLGSFCVLCAVLNKFYSFKHPYGAEWVFWYTREVSTAVIVANLPHMWALVRKVFRVPSFIAQSETRNSIKPSSRVFQDVEDPLSHGPARKNTGRGDVSLESVDIDKILADVERDATPMKPAHSQDIRDVAEWGNSGGHSQVRMPASPTPVYKVRPSTPNTPFETHSGQHLLAGHASPLHSPLSPTFSSASTKVSPKSSPKFPPHNHF